MCLYIVNEKNESHIEKFILHNKQPSHDMLVNSCRESKSRPLRAKITKHASWPGKRMKLTDHPGMVWVPNHPMGGFFFPQNPYHPGVVGHFHSFPGSRSMFCDFCSLCSCSPCNCWQACCVMVANYAKWIFQCDFHFFHLQCINTNVKTQKL